MAAVDYFLAIDGVKGESRDARHKGEIELDSFSWGAASTGGRAGGAAGGAGAGKVQVEDLHVVMRTNAASPQLLLACTSGKHLKQAVLTARKAGKGQLDYLVVRLADVLVASYRMGGAVDAAPIDQVALRFARVEVELRTQQDDGSLGPAVKAGWDVKAGRQL